MNEWMNESSTHADAECGEELWGGAHEVGQVPALQ